MLVCLGLLAGIASALPPDPLVVAFYPVAGEMGYPVDPALTYLEANYSQLAGHPMRLRCGTNATGTFVWSNWVGPTGNDTINYPFYATLYEHTYYWTVWANDSYGNSSNTTFSFTTEGADPNVTITYPVDGSTISTFTHIDGTCDNASSVIYALLFDFDNSLYWNWASGNWSLIPLNYSTPIGVTSWTITADMPTLVSGRDYGIAVYGNNSYNTDFDSVGFTYLIGGPYVPHTAGVSVVVKILVSLCLFVCAGAIAFWGFEEMFRNKLPLKSLMKVMITVMVVCVALLALAGVIIMM